MQLREQALGIVAIVYELLGICDKTYKYQCGFLGGVDRSKAELVMLELCIQSSHAA